MTHRTTMLALALLLAPTATWAQHVEGRLVDARNGAGVEGAFVALFDGDEAVAVDLTAADGGFALSAPAPGTYRLRAERVGYRTITSEPFDLSRGEVLERELVSTVEAISLEPIAVVIRNAEDEEACRTNPAAVERLAAAWEEARKGLTGTAWTSRYGLVEMDVRRYERLYEARSGRILSRTSKREFGVSGASPFVSVGLERLREDGFATFDDEGARYFGPDPEVVLSDWFLGTHCFRMTTGEGDREGLLGLEFGPVEGRGEPEIAGTLWLDPERPALHSLDYRYVRMPDWVDDLAKGHLSFRRLPSGQWIVDEWWIEAPEFEAGDWRDWGPRRYGRGGGALLRVVGGELVEILSAVR